MYYQDREQKNNGLEISNDVNNKNCILIWIVGCLSCSAYTASLLYAPWGVEVGSGVYRSVPVMICCKAHWDCPCGGVIALYKLNYYYYY